jgi:hypothetical protein
LKDYKFVVEEAMKRNIDPEFAVKLFKKRYPKLSEEDFLRLDNRTKLEDFFTEFDRVK